MGGGRFGEDASELLRGVKCVLPDSAIDALVEERHEARMSKDYGMADAIRDDLLKAGVHISDVEGTWTTSDGRRGYLPQMEGRKEDRIETPVIYQLLRKRAKHRQWRQFDQADEIRARLESYGVIIDDESRTWSTLDGRTGVTDGKKDRKKFWGDHDSQKKMPGDWECSQCGSLNFAKRDECYKCGASRSGR
uniref:RanBP2-type domain-containing protein n=1 Tax=Lotharella globosa TaxID=91324 RepID=A0A7S3Z9B0_9EUKA|mmetsp:Transcript_31738/g.61423  ORF Transcript_31738/g.61423 Transcript_31738/m.61423 type:complete len:192 (+) Transcript_31738:3-578(+)